MTIYEKNCLALHEFHPELEDLLSQDISTSHIEVQKAESGASRLAVQLESGSVAYVHNGDDPVSVATRTAEKLNANQGGVLVMMGMGLGYVAKELALGLEDGSALIVYEADPGIFKTAMQEVDLTPVFSSPLIKLVVGPEARLEGWCHQFMLQTGGAVRLARFEPAFRLAPELYERKWEKELLGFTQALAMNFATVGQFGPLFSRAILGAVPHILFSQGVNQLEGKFKGVPAILVAAGPSLEKNAHYLKEAKGRTVIICADTVLGYLLARDIIPDFVVSVDPQATTFSKYEGVNIPEEIALVFHPACNDQIFKRFPGPKFVTETKMLIYQWLNEFFQEKGSLEGDIQCQMHMGFNLAKLMGCDPIIITGQDLCYTDSLMHVKGGSYLTEAEEAIHVAQGMVTKNIFGETVKTYPVFWTYKTTFERKIEEFQGTVLNATEGGLPLKGAEIVRLTDALSQFSQSQTINVSNVICEFGQDLPDVDWENLLQEVGSRIRDFHRIIRVSRRICRLVAEIQEEQKCCEEPSPLLIELSHQTEHLTKFVPAYAKALGLLQMVDFGLELYMLREDTGKIDRIENAKDKLSKQLERGMRYYGALLRVAPAMQGSIRQLYRRLETLKSLHGKFSPPQSLLPIEKVHKYVEVEMYDRAAEWLKCLPQSCSREDVVTAVSVYEKMNALDNALSQKNMIQEQFGCDGEIQELCVRIQVLWEAWQKKKAQSTAVMARALQQSEMPLAGGDFYFRVKKYDRAIEHYRKAISSLSQNSSEGWYRVAKACQASRNEAEAVEAFQKALVADPSDSRVYFELGVMALKRQQIDVAERFFLKGSEMSLEDAEYCEAVGSVWCAVGLPGKAIPFYEQAIVQNPGNAELISKINQSYQSIFAVGLLA